jgi:hypothetical protein
MTQTLSARAIHDGLTAFGASPLQARQVVSTHQALDFGSARLWLRGAFIWSGPAVLIASAERPLHLHCSYLAALP